MSESASTQAIDGVERELTVDEKKNTLFAVFQQLFFTMSTFSRDSL